MEQFFKTLPPAVLALIVLAGAIILFIVSNPMHTLCDTQGEVLQQSQTGPLFPQPTQVRDERGKHNQTLPPRIVAAKEKCQIGNSGGACYEYFSILKQLAVDIGKVSTECFAQMFELPNVERAFRDGVEVMTRIAWGPEPPALWWNRSGWLQESELAIFCRMKNIYIRTKGQEEWDALRQSIFAKLPGEAPVVKTDPNQIVAEPKRAIQVLSEQEILNRSIFAVRCESFL